MNLDELHRHLEQALDAVAVPTYVIDAAGVIRWLNNAAERVVGDARGRQFTSLVAPEDRRRSRELFARKIVGMQPTEAELSLISDSGAHLIVELSSVPLIDDGHAIGVFGQVTAITDAASREPTRHVCLTARQTEILRELERGRSTRQIAEKLSLSPETVKNHVRHILRALGVHSRLEAVAVARAADVAIAR